MAASIRSGNCKDNIQAVEVDNFMKSIHPHWISSSANNIVGPSGDIVLSSMTLHQACRQEKAPNSELNLTPVEMSGDALAKPLTDPALTPITCNTIQNDNVAAQQSVQTKENDSKAAPDEPNETGTAGDSKTNKSGSNTNKTTPKDKSDSDKVTKRKRATPDTSTGKTGDTTQAPSQKEAPLTPTRALRRRRTKKHLGDIVGSSV